MKQPLVFTQLKTPVMFAAMCLMMTFQQQVIKYCVCCWIFISSNLRNLKQAYRFLLCSECTYNSNINFAQNTIISSERELINELYDARFDRNYLHNSERFPHVPVSSFLLFFLRSFLIGCEVYNRSDDSNFLRLDSSI